MPRRSEQGSDVEAEAAGDRQSGSIGGQVTPARRGDFLGKDQGLAQSLYEELHCQRGEMENGIKEQLSLFAGRVSAETMRANQVRLYPSGMAYVLVSALRRLGLAGTELARAQVTARQVWIQLAASFPLAGVV